PNKWKTVESRPSPAHYLAKFWPPLADSTCCDPFAPRCAPCASPLRRSRRQVVIPRCPPLCHPSADGSDASNEATMSSFAWTMIVAMVAAIAISPRGIGAQAAPATPPRLDLKPCVLPGGGPRVGATCGTLVAFEHQIGRAPV